MILKGANFDGFEGRYETCRSGPLFFLGKSMKPLKLPEFVGPLEWDTDI